MRHTRPGNRTALTALLVLLDACPLLLVLAVYRYSSLQDLGDYLRSSFGLAALMAAATGLLAGILLMRHLRRLPAVSRRPAFLLVTLNALTLVLTLVSGEIFLRVLHEIDMRWPLWSQHHFILRSWDRTSQAFRQALESGSTMGSYHEFDPLLGWHIGANRRSPDGLYASSVEGLRSDRPGVSLLLRPTLTATGLGAHRPSLRVALVGDSFTFGYEVSYRDSWAQALAARLGGDFQILNFGVIGYGINQSRLKYERDVRPLHPDIVVFSAISHDFERDATIYNFLPFPGQLNLPYPRPRPVLRDGRLETINTPLPTPEEVFKTASLGELPFIEYDANYDWMDWERPRWRWLQQSFLFRTLTSWPAGPLPARSATFEQEKWTLEPRVLQAFADSVRQDGAVPIFVFFPERHELDSSTEINKPQSPQGIRMFRAAGLPYEDTTECMRRVPRGHRYAPQDHFSVESNTAVAECLLPTILRHTADRTPPANHL